MKTRNGYVSNSSSSSFVIAYDKFGALVIQGVSDVITIDDFFEAIEHSRRNWTSEDTCVVSCNEDELLSSYGNNDGLSQYEIHENEMFMPLLKKFISENKRDGVGFAEISISYHDEFIRKLYCMFKRSGVVVELNETER